MTVHIDPPRKVVTSSFVDQDEIETADWLASLGSLHRSAGDDRVRYILAALDRRAKEIGVLPDAPPYSPYRNSIPLETQKPYPGDVALETRLTAIIRWNALAMVVRANKAYGELGGHVASYASVAEIFEVGFNHFFRASTDESEGDVVYFQPHSSPGVYARAYLEGRLSEENLKLYRQELSGPGLASYPHPWLMPEFWQVPTASMGLGPISAIYQARFMKYLEHRGLVQTHGRHVWGVFGDGEMDEPESIAGLALAAREKLDNLTFIVNCNLQRLDGPVRGNGQVIQELESIFQGAGWNVIKVLWGSGWDDIFARDSQHALLRKFAETVDGKYQTLGAKDGAYNLANFFSEDPEVRALVAHMSDADIDGLKRGGHDVRKIFAAFAAAKDTKGRPTVILAKTKKGYGMGGAGESRMTSHQAKKLDIDALYAFRDRLNLPLTNQQVENLEFFKPAEDSAELKYLRERREALGGYMPVRRRWSDDNLAVPPLQSYGDFALRGDGKETSTTMAIVRLFSNLLKDKTLGPRVIPIVADEARTFGMANLFRQVGIYSPVGQLYEPEDAGSMLYYKEATDGQLLEEGITEAGAISSWTAAATSYSIHNFALLPFYIYYSMFGFQRIGDLIWAAADQRARGFLIGATAGRTTLGGEGLQHQDGSSHVIAATIPNCRAYDPAFSYEVATIVDHGMRSMLEEGRDEFYYLTVMNENYAQPSMPAGVEHDIIKGLYQVTTTNSASPQVRLVGSGAILPEIMAAAKLLEDDWQIASEVWSATSFSELAREAREVERHNRLNPLSDQIECHASKCLSGGIPVVAASDYVRAYPQLIASYIEAPYTVLGTDGFGRSDTRAALRSFFEVDRKQIVLAALSAAARAGKINRERVADAIKRYEMTVDVDSPWSR